MLVIIVVKIGGILMDEHFYFMYVNYNKRMLEELVHEHKISQSTMDIIRDTQIKYWTFGLLFLTLCLALTILLELSIPTFGWFIILFSFLLNISIYQSIKRKLSKHM